MLGLVHLRQRPVNNRGQTMRIHDNTVAGLAAIACRYVLRTAAARISHARKSVEYCTSGSAIERMNDLTRRNVRGSMYATQHRSTAAGKGFHTRHKIIICRETETCASI
jgi:hypothetical protein